MPDAPSTRVLAEGRYLRLIAQDHWEYADRCNAHGAVAIVAVTGQRELLLVEQFRIPLGNHVIELPAGLVGDETGTKDEPLSQAATRELLEETGYRAGEMLWLTRGPTTAGLATEIVDFFLAQSLVQEHPGGGIEHESIVVHAIPLDEVESWLRSQSDQGRLIDPKIYAGLYLAGVKRTQANCV